MGKLDLSKYLNKTKESTVSADEWNAIFSDIQEVVNDNNVSTGVSDVLVDGVSVVNNGVANISLESSSKTSSDFYVNGALTLPINGVVRLDAGNSYTLSGSLEGSVLIEGSADIVVDTFITLNGVHITNTSDRGYCIKYAPEAQTLYVNVLSGSELKSTYEAENSAQQLAALYSEKNMVINGESVLYIENAGGHGIKASELRIMGNNYIRVSATHDAIHGNSALDIYGGIFDIRKANDAFGTGDTGLIRVFGGEITALNIAENVFDSKLPGYFFARIPIKTSVSDVSVAVNNMTYVTPSVYYPVGTVTCYSDADMTADAAVISAVDGVYKLTTKYAKITGYIEGLIQVDTKSTDISLDNAYIKGNVLYTPDGKKLQITAEKDTVNFIVSDSEDAVHSNKNVAIEVKNKSYLKLYSASGSGLVGDDVTLNDSSGVLDICDCGKYGIYGYCVYIGTQEDVNPEKTFDGLLVVCNNTKADIYAAIRSATGTDGTVTLSKGNVVIANSGLRGCAIVNSIEVETSANFDSSLNVRPIKTKGLFVGYQNNY